MIVGIITTILAVLAIFVTIFKPPQSRNIKMLISTVVIFLGMLAIFGMIHEFQMILEKRIKFIPSNSKYHGALELPNFITNNDLDKYIIVPFKAEIGVDQVTAKIYIGDRNIVLDIEKYSDSSAKQKYDITKQDNKIVLYQGDVFLNIPFKIRDIQNNILNMKFEIIQKNEQQNTIPLSYEINFEPWEFSCDFSKHELGVGEPLKLTLHVKNNGAKSEFYIKSKLYRDGELIKSSFLNENNPFEIDADKEITIPSSLNIFNEPGSYVIDLSVIKEIDYLENRYNMSWQDNYKSKFFYFVISDTSNDMRLSIDLPLPNENSPDDYPITFQFSKTITEHAEEYGVRVWDLIYWNHEKIKNIHSIRKDVSFVIPKNRSKPNLTWILPENALIYDRPGGREISTFTNKTNVYVLDNEGSWSKVLLANYSFTMGWTLTENLPISGKIKTFTSSR